MTSNRPVAGKAAVIGAGIGGLTAAWRLQQAGFEVEVFESAARPGGRLRSLQVAGSVIDTGATVFLPAYRETIELIREMGLEADLQAVRGSVVIPRDGRLHAIDIDAPLKAVLTPLIGWRSKLALIAPLMKFWSLRKALGFLSLGGAAGHDDETLAAYCQRRFAPEVYTYLLNPALKFLYLHNGESGSLVELLWWMRASGRGKPRSLRLGSESLTDALARRLKIHTQSEVTQISRDAEGVRIAVQNADAATRIHRADVCVVTVPGTIAAAICKDGLSERQRAFLHSRRYDPSICVSFCTRARPALDALMLMMPDDADADLATIIFAHNIGPQRAPAEQGLINAYFMKPWSERHGREPDEALMRLAQAHVAAWVPEVCELVAWNVQRWSHTAAISEPGDCARMRAFESEVDPQSPIQIIGDFQAQASMNVAVANANRAARRLIGRAALPGFDRKTRISPV